MHCWNRSRAQVEAKDALYFNPEMYTRFILCRVPKRYPYPTISHNKLFQRLLHK